MKTATLAFAALVLMGGRVAAETPAAALTRGKLEADMGRLQSASEAFEAVAHASDAAPQQRWEALVRLGVARRAAGDARGSADAFEETWHSYGRDPEAVRFLLQALGSALPSQERWDEAWEKVVITVDRTHPDRPVVGVAWPGASRLERAGVGQTISVDFKDGNLVDIFRMLADVSGLNVVVQPGVGGTVTILARDLPWEELLQRVLAPYGFLGRIDGNVLWIGRPGEAPRSWKDDAGEPIDVDFAAVPLTDVLVQVAARGGARVVIPQGVAGQVTIRLKAVPWLQAFDLIANANGLVWERRGPVIEVRPRIHGNVLRIVRPVEAPQRSKDDAGERIDVDFAAAPLTRVLVQVAARGGARVVFPEGVAGQVTIRLKGVPWLQAFDLIANANGLVWERRGPVIEVRPRHP